MRQKLEMTEGFFLYFLTDKAMGNFVGRGNTYLHGYFPSLFSVTTVSVIIQDRPHNGEEEGSEALSFIPFEKYLANRPSQLSLW